MSVVSVKAKDFILALFIRDDGERFLLGDNGFDFADSQMHFAANTIENDEVAKQGTDGVMVAGQVRRSSVQSFDGYVGDGTTPKETIEQMRRAFIAYFAKGHHFRVVYVDTARNAWQRKGGYLVDAPEVKELYQIHPEYHVGLNFEDVNYYSYDENADGDEILANLVDVPISSDVEGGLEWDSDGAISEDATIEIDGETATETGKNISVNDSVDAPISSFQLDGETSQQTYTGKNLLTTAGIEVTTKNGVTLAYDANTQTITLNGTCGTDNTVFSLITGNNITINGTYTLSYYVVGGTINPTGATRIQLFDSNWGDSFLRLLGQTTGSATETRNTTLAYGGIRVDSGSVFNNYKFKIQFEKNSSRTDWEPFVGRTAAPNPSYPQAVQTVTGENVVKISDGQGNEQSYEINLGKNLFDKSTVTDGYRLGSDGTPYADAGYSLSTYIPVQPNTQYSYSRGEKTTGASNAICYYDNSKTFISRTTPIINTQQTSGTLTTPSNAAYVRIAELTSQLDTMQYELGSQATSYAPYFTPIELCKIGTYQDYIYKSGDKWYVHKEISYGVYDGTEEGWVQGYGRIEYQNSNIKLGSSTDNPVICDHYQTTWGVGTCIFLSGARGSVCIVDPDNFGSNLAIFKTWIANNNLTIAYALVTPTDTEITNATLIAQLEAILSQARTYAGTTNITTVIATGNEQGTLEVEYYTSYKQVITGGGYVWEDGGSGGATTIINNSISAVSPVWTVHGSVTNPTLENVTTGETIEYVGTIGAGQTLTVDMGEQTASLDGLNVIGNIVGDFISLAPGGNTLLYSATGDAPDSEIGWSEIVG